MRLSKIKWVSTLLITLLSVAVGHAEAACTLTDAHKISPPGVSVWWPRWLPDGQHIIFAEWRGERRQVSLSTQTLDALYIIDINGNNLKMVGKEVDIASVIISPDGKAISSKLSRRAHPQNRDDFYVLDLETGNKRLDLENQTLKWRNARSIKPPEQLKTVWILPSNPTVAQILNPPEYLKRNVAHPISHQVESISKDGRIALLVGNGRYSLLDLQTEQIQPLSPKLPGSGHIVASDISPDGRYVVLAVATDITTEPEVVIGQSDLFITDASSSVDRLTDTKDVLEYSPAWSPDGKHLLFTDNKKKTLSIGNIDCK